MQGTINGYGERCGNANLVSVIADLQLKMDHQVVPAESLSRLVDLSRYVSELANLDPDIHQPFVGDDCLCPQGGHACQRCRQIYHELSACGANTRGQSDAGFGERIKW